MTKLIQQGIHEDSLVCGSCQRNFPFGNFVNFVQHKQFDCNELAAEVMEALVCQSCPQEFGTPWSLLRHAQTVHALKIYYERSSRGSRKDQGKENTSRTEIQNSTFDLKILGMVEGQSEEVPNAKDTQGLSRKPEETLHSKTSNETLLSDASNCEQLSHCPPQTREVLRTVTCDQTLYDRNRKCSEMKDFQNLTLNIHADAGTDDDSKMNECSKSGSLTHEALDPKNPHTQSLDGGIKKCCSSVIPKKRKRHMETKHMFGAMGGSSAKGRRRLGSPERPTNIYIDFETHEEYMPEYRRQQCDDQVYSGGESEGCDSSERRNERTDCRQGLQFPSSFKQHSVIIQPGMTLSIPVSYAMNMTPSTATYKSGAPSSLVLSMPQTNNIVMDSMSEEKDSSCDQSVKKQHREESVQRDRGLEGLPVGKQYSIKVPPLSSLETSSQSDSNTVFLGQTMHDGDVDYEVNQSTDVQGQKKRRYPTSRPFKCDKCEDSFNQRIHLQKHQSKHTGVKPFKCDRCDYSTVERSHLKVHIRVHTGEKPYKCTFCGYATAQNSTLKIHLKRHHSALEKGNIFTCGTCGMHFQHRDSFANHKVHEHSQIGSGDNAEPASSPFEVLDQSTSCEKTDGRPD